MPSQPRGSVTVAEQEPLLITMIGEVDLFLLGDRTQQDLHRQIAGHDEVRVDLSSATFLDSVGLGFLLDVRQLTGSTPVLMGVSQPMLNMLKLCGVDQLFAYEPDR